MICKVSRQELPLAPYVAYVRAIIPYFPYGVNRGRIYLFLNFAPGLAPEKRRLGSNRAEPNSQVPERGESTR